MKNLFHRLSFRLRMQPSPLHVPLPIYHLSLLARSQARCLSSVSMAWRLVRQKLLLDALSQTITRDEAVETGFLPQSIFQVCRLQEQLLLWLIQQTGEVPVGPFNLPAQILRPPGCRLEPAAEGFHIITRDAPLLSATHNAILHLISLFLSCRRSNFYLLPLARLNHFLTFDAGKWHGI